MNVKRGIWILVVCLAVGSAQAQMSLEADYRCTGSAMVQAFEAQRKVLQTSSAVIIDGRTEAGYGVVVSADGHILVKASEFQALKEPEVIIDRKRFREVKLLASDRDWDVSLIKVDATGLVPVVDAPTSEVGMGTWVVTNGVTSRLNRRLLIGVISANTRELPPLGGLVLGVVLKEEDGGLKVLDLMEGAGAADAGIEKEDVLVEVEGKGLAKIKDLTEALKGYGAGDKVKVTLKRGGEEKVVEVKLAIRDEASQGKSRNDQMSGDFSKRRSDFPRVLQHSILGNSRTVGGPLLDLDGRCLGMNIARATRAESFAIPVEDLRQLTERLMAAAADKDPG